MTVLTALSLLWTTSSALAQETPSPVMDASATASASKSPAQRSHRVLFGSSVGGGSYGADAAAVLGIDASYAYRTASGRDLGVTGTLATSHVFAGAFGDLLVARLTRDLSWRFGGELGLHRISNEYRSFDLFP
ncbi:MAG TPA: hypothetical protein VNM90_19800, partial [Haliangium sp.]|nr:hypothetical protein [Haliangium sp.]